MKNILLIVITLFVFTGCIDPVKTKLYDYSNRKQNLIEATHLIQNGENFDSCDVRHALSDEDIESIKLVEEMLKNKKNIDKKCTFNTLKSDTFDCISHVKKFKLLEKYGYLDLNNIFYVCIKDPDVINYLVTKNIDLNKKDENGRTPLLVHSYVGKSSVIQRMINFGAKINVQDNYGETALHRTVKNSFNRLQNNGIHITTDPEEFKIIDMLIENGADITIKNNDGKTAVESALTSDLAHRILDTSERVAIEKYKKGLLSIEDIRRLGKIITEQRGKIVTIYVKVDKQERVNPITSFFNTVGDVVAGAGNVAGNVINGLGSSNALGNYKAKTDTSTYLKDSSKQIHERYNSLKAITESNNTVKDSSSNSISNMTPEEQGYKERLVTRTINNKAEVKKEVKEEIKKEERYDYKLVEAMTYVWKSGEYWYAYGKNGNMIQLRSEAEALSSTDCSPRGLGVSHTYDGKKGNVYYCGEPLNKVGFGSSDLAGRYGVGPGLTNSRKVWNCKTQSPGNSWQNLCKDY